MCPGVSRCFVPTHESVDWTVDGGARMMCRSMMRCSASGVGLRRRPATDLSSNPTHWRACTRFQVQASCRLPVPNSARLQIANTITRSTGLARVVLRQGAHLPGDFNGLADLEGAKGPERTRKDSKGPKKHCRITSFLPHAGGDYLMLPVRVGNVLHCAPLQGNAIPQA
jgi:hypothetical protein